MAELSRKPLTSWTYIGAGAVALAVVLAAVGLALAIAQTRSAVLQRLAELRPEAIQTVAVINSRIREQVQTTLIELSTNQGVTGPTNRPAWMPVVFIRDRSLPFALTLAQDKTGVSTWDADRIIKLVTPRLDLRMPTADDTAPLNDVQYMHEEIEEVPVVIAYMPSTGVSGYVILAAILDVRRLQEELVQPMLAARPRLTLAPSGPTTELWSEPLAPVLPFWSVRPSESYVAQQHQSADRQGTVYVVITVLTLLALLAVVWAMNQVLRREMALGQLKSDFVADVSHELKTPLALIQMFGETLLEDRVRSEDKKREYYEIILRETRRLTHLINNILDFSRREAGKKDYKMGPVRAEDVVRQTYESYRHDLDHKGFTHSLKVAPGLPEVRADSDALSQAVLNLISNAVKYSEDDRFIEVELAPETRRGREGVLISVRDRGIGIRPEDRAHLFDGFFRAADDRVRKKRGAGLGLSLVRDIIEAHHGFVEVEPRLVKGTAFHLFVPRSIEGGAEREAARNEENDDG